MVFTKECKFSRGKISDDKNEPLPGATIVVVHEPSGTIYGATSNNQEFYSIECMRPGVPYKYKLQLQP